MKVACISDLHLSNNGFADSFQHKEESFLHFLDYLEENYDQIVLNGDIYDPCKSLKLQTHLNEVYQIQEKYRRLDERFNTDQYVFVTGNHDQVMENIGYQSFYNFQDSEGTNYSFLHGHQFDNLRGKGLILYYFTALVDWIEKVLWKDAEAYLSWLEGKLLSLLKMGPSEMLKVEVQKLFMNKNDRHVIVMGHSHEPPSKVEYGNHIYLNSGACVRKRVEYVHIDTDEKEYRTESWSQTNRFGIAIKTDYSLKNGLNAMNN